MMTGRELIDVVRGMTLEERAELISLLGPIGWVHPAAPDRSAKMATREAALRMNAEMAARGENWEFC